jgi:hypothetical protein
MVTLKSGTAPGPDKPMQISPKTRPHKKPGAQDRHHQASPLMRTRHHGLVVIIIVSSKTMVRGL